MADQPTNDWRTTLKRRLTVTAVVVVLWACAIEARLVYLQVVERADLAARAERQQSSQITAPGKRGDILDRNGHLLAYSVDAESVIRRPHRAARRRQGSGASGGHALRRSKGLHGGRAEEADRALQQATAVCRGASSGLAGTGEADRRSADGGHRLHQGKPPLLSRIATSPPTFSAIPVWTTMASPASKPLTTS